MIKVKIVVVNVDITTQPP